MIWWRERLLAADNKIDRWRYQPATYDARMHGVLPIDTRTRGGRGDRWVEERQRKGYGWMLVIIECYDE